MKQCKNCGKLLIRQSYTLCRTCSNKNRTGKKFTEEQKQRMKEAQKLNVQRPDYTPPFLGKHHSPETMARIIPKIFGEKHWKGDNVGYPGMHRWIKKLKPKQALCELCKKVPPFDIANKSGKYKREVEDWMWICRKCHQIKDETINNRDKKGKI